MTPKEKADALLFKCDEAACKLDPRFYEAFDMDERWEIIRAILATATGVTFYQRVEIGSGFIKYEPVALPRS